MKWRALLLIAISGLAFLLLCALPWAIWYEPPTDDRLVHPSVLSIRQPIQKVASSFYGDGGSSSVSIKDAGGTWHSFWVAYPMSNPGIRGKLFIGHYTDGVAVDENAYPHTRRALFSLTEHLTTPLQYCGIAFTRLADNPLYIVRAHLKDRATRRAFENPP